MANENRYIDTLESKDLNSFGQAMVTASNTLSSVKNKEILEKMLNHIVASEFSSELITAAENILERMNKETGERFREELQDDVLRLTETGDYRKLKDLVLKRIDNRNR
ncbi:uncharacterized protein LOC126569069 [Anopheles aquasalis]|uniref:uncharacterized protein LOC126569069 n=1 Tax=Anopheles aquasalis TaxID=42839 RepID=UPI00215ABA45|nr:uncharacterized protein LOC126569069 [Anopheles aquasalis]